MLDCMDNFRDRGKLQCDECGGLFTAQLLPIHLCPPAMKKDIDELELEVSKLQAELALIKQDALRYRWLREPQEHVSVEFEDENEDGYTMVFYSKIRTELDAAVDAAIDRKRKA